MAAEVVPPQMEVMHMRLPSKSNLTQVSIKPLKAKVKKLDPLRALEPSRKKLSTVESQRIMAVLDETMKRTELVSILPQILENIDRFSVVLGPELVSLLNEHKVLKEGYDDITRKLDEVHGTSSLPEEDPYDYGEDFYTRPRSKPSSHSAKSEASAKSAPASRPASAGEIEALVKNQQAVASNLAFSCKNILRAFSSNLSATQAILKEYTHRPRSVRSLISGCEEMKDVMMERLLTTPLEAEEKIDYLVQVTQSERHNATIIEKLEAELNAANEDKDEEICKKNEVIRRLQADLHQIEKFSEAHIRRTKSEAEKQEAADQKNSEGKKTKLLGEMNQLKTQLQNLISEHREGEQVLRKKKYKIETEVENWIQKYDQDMGDRQDEYEEIDLVYTEEKKQLHELEERFKTLEEEYKQITEERRIAREAREEAEHQVQLMLLAASTIQAFWRSFKVRKMLRGKKKKEKGKGKRKGKGKKK